MVGPLEFLDAGRQCGFISFSVVLLMCANGSQAQTSVLGAVTVSLPFQFALNYFSYQRFWNYHSQ